MVNRICTTCGEEKPGEDFYSRSHGDCKVCRRVSVQKWGAANKERKAAARRARYVETRRRVMDLKLRSKCTDCGWAPTTDLETSSLEFDHVDPMSKAPTSSGAAFDYSWGWARIEEQIALCELRCTECHRLRTTRLGHRHLRKAIA